MTDVHRTAKRLDLEVSQPNSKLSTKQLFKLALRLVKMFNLQLCKRPTPAHFTHCAYTHSQTSTYVYSIICSHIHTPDKFPGLASQRLSICLSHLLRLKYNRTVTNANLADLIRAAVRYARVPSKVRFERFRHHNMFVDGSMYTYIHMYVRVLVCLLKMGYMCCLWCM